MIFTEMCEAGKALLMNLHWLLEQKPEWGTVEEDFPEDGEQLVIVKRFIITAPYELCNTLGRQFSSTIKDGIIAEKEAAANGPANEVKTTAQTLLYRAGDTTIELTFDE